MLEVSLGSAKDWFLHKRHLSRFKLSVQCLNKIKRSVSHFFGLEAPVEIILLSVERYHILKTIRVIHQDNLHELAFFFLLLFEITHSLTF